jgi:hypothetical protein
VHSSTIISSESTKQLLTDLARRCRIAALPQDRRFGAVGVPMDTGDGPSKSSGSGILTARLLPSHIDQLITPGVLI